MKREFLSFIAFIYLVYIILNILTKLLTKLTKDFLLRLNKTNISQVSFKRFRVVNYPRKNLRSPQFNIE